MKKVLFLLLFVLISVSNTKAQECSLQKMDFKHSANKEVLSCISTNKGEICKCPWLDCAYINHDMKRISLKSNADNNRFTYYLYEETGRLIDACSVDLNKGETAYVSTERVNESSFVLVLESNDGLYFAQLKKL